jgi:hypothetical protein
MTPTTTASNTGNTTKADHWRTTNPSKYAQYIAAVAVIHREVLAAARDWLGVDAFIASDGRLVVALGGREVGAPLHPDAATSPVALRRQIVALASRLHGRTAKKRASAARWTLTVDAAGLT